MIGEWYKRWRHTRGFGVHSPFAFALLGAVIRPGRNYSYYGYLDIENALVSESPAHACRHARMLLRLASFLNVRSAFIPNDAGAAVFRAALLAANSHMKISAALADAVRCQLIVSTSDYVPLDILLDSVQRNNSVLALDNVPDGWTAQLFDALPQGVMFYSPDALIVVNRPDMHKVSYSVSL